MADTWKDAASAPTDGRPLLLIARLNIDGEKLGPIVGHWHQTEDEWRLTTNDSGTELIISRWMEIPKYD
jgi:hypothetical protein